MSLQRQHASGGSGLVATLAIMVAAASFGTLPLFAKTLHAYDLAPQAIAFWRFTLTALCLAPIALRPGIDGRALVWALVGGATIGLGWIGYVMALEVLSVAQTGVLFMTFPVFALLIGAVGFGERVRAPAAAGAVLIILAAIAVVPKGALAGGTIGAILLALMTPLAYGFLINVLSHRLGRLPPLAAVAAIALGSVLALIPLLVRLPVDEIVPREPVALAWLVAFGLMTALLPQLLMVHFARQIGAGRTALAGSAELPATLLVGYLAFAEPFRPVHALAAALIFGAIALSTRGAPATGK